MATKKAFIKLDKDIIIPITRGEAVFDSKGEEAFHSYEFVASKVKPGLLTPLEKIVIQKSIIVSQEIPENKIVLVLKLDTDNNEIDIYPVTKAEAVIVNVENNKTTLDKIIKLVLNLDDYPTLDSLNGVTSGGVWLHVDDTVGAIHREVNKI